MMKLLSLVHLLPYHTCSTVTLSFKLHAYFGLAKYLCCICGGYLNYIFPFLFFSFSFVLQFLICFYVACAYWLVWTVGRECQWKSVLRVLIRSVLWDCHCVVGIKWINLNMEWFLSIHIYLWTFMSLVLGLPLQLVSCFVIWRSLGHICLMLNIRPFLLLCSNFFWHMTWKLFAKLCPLVVFPSSATILVKIPDMAMFFP